MIEKMQIVHIVTKLSNKDEMLKALRELGILHIAARKNAEHSVSDQALALSKTIMLLNDYAPEEKDEAKKTAVLSDEEFEKLSENVYDALDRKSKLEQVISANDAEIDRLVPWGDFSPRDLQILRDGGVDFHFYKLSLGEYEKVVADKNIRMIHLTPKGKFELIAVVDELPAAIQATELTLPEKSISQLRKENEEHQAEVDSCIAILKDASEYEASFNAQLLKAQNAELYSSADASTGGDDRFVWISGYIPTDELTRFKDKASELGWAYAITDVSDDDDQIPTKVRYGKVSRLIQPVFDILGILPGYHEQDISLWFFLFFILFFAMIIGDAGYGLLVLLGTLGFTFKTKKSNDATFLLTVLSVATIIWGAITGTWFGMESAMKVPFLKALVIPNFANYPQYFGVTATAQQNTIMKFSFSIGAIQMALGSLLSIKKKLKEKNLSWLADLGWVIAIIAMYLLSLYLVIGDNINIVPIFAAIGIAFVMVVLFGGMSPDKSFAQGIKAGLADSFTTFLNTISCFGNVMSYIRLFAVGMAGLAIAQSFNAIGAGFHGPLMVVGIIVVLIGHVLNIIMAFLSVVVHGVRLNVLEFSGQVGLEWTGVNYDPFKLNTKVK